MSRPWDDCKFFLTSGCRNVHCKFRHFDAAKNGENCEAWARGQCQDMACAKKVCFNKFNFQLRLFSTFIRWPRYHVVLNLPPEVVRMPLVISNTVYLEAMVNCNKRYYSSKQAKGNHYSKLTALLAEHENGKNNDSTDPVSWLHAECYNF